VREHLKILEQEGEAYYDKKRRIWYYEKDPLLGLAKELPLRQVLPPDCPECLKLRIDQLEGEYKSPMPKEVSEAASADVYAKSDSVPLPVYVERRFNDLMKLHVLAYHYYNHTKLSDSEKEDIKLKINRFAIKRITEMYEAGMRDCEMKIADIERRLKAIQREAPTEVTAPS